MPTFSQTPLSHAVVSFILLGISPLVIANEEASDQETAVLPSIVLHADEQGEKTEGTGSYKAKASKGSAKLNLSIQETPQSVSVITREQIEQRNLNIIDDVLMATPGITVTKLDSERSSYYSRGYPITNRQIDGMPIGDNSPRTDSFFFDRIEVVKGATGLSGSTGNPSATINMIRKRPTKELSGYASTSFSRWDTIRNEADVSVPLTQDGRIRSRVMAMHEQGDSYMDYYSLESTAAMAMVEADFSDHLTGSVGFQYQDNQPKGSTWGAVPYWNADGSLANLPRNFSLANRWNTISQNDRTAFADLSYKFANDWLIKAAASYSYSKNFWLMSYGGSGFPKSDGTGIGLWSTVYPTQESKKTNLELYTTGPFKLFNREHEFILGANGYQRSSDAPTGALYGNIGDQVTCTGKNETIANNIAGSCLINNWQSWNGNATTQPNYTVTPSTKDAKQQNYGVYSTVRLSITDPLKLIVGGRYSEYKATNGTKSDVKADAFTPYVGITYDITPLVTAYASYTDIFSPSTNKDRNNKFLDPETGKAYEIGIKTSLLNEQLLATAAIFSSEKENIAVRDLEAVNQGIKTDDGADPMMASGEGYKVEGFEVEAIGQITKGWNVSAGYTYVNSVSSPQVSALTNVPQNLVKVYTNLKLPEAWWDGAEKLNVGFGVNWQSEVKRKWGGAPSNTDGFVRQDAYFLASANIGYDFSKNLSANLQFNNLFDEKYYQEIGFYNGVYWGEPRNVTLTLKAKF
ncbi:TonB-dependent siderophore receptor [Acinetobacter ursingii]|uniref:TonB-dependent siderophore receptor n=1 Tax=Acinetobacter ursingii TaxID=108980 RepID=UPI00124F8A29|nr:TonB-dependent siderophore receptor [Acinetobacter ursingii]MCU4609135.1 TonB-dependent siderophore receptor [Acinetobacter ursingii]